MSRKRKPSYLLHKPTNQARVIIDGKTHYLGEFGSSESRDRYDDLIAEWFARNGDTSRYTLRIDDLALLFLKHADQHYRKNGKVTSEVSCIKIALKYLIACEGRTRVRDFGPLAFKKVREAMISDGHCRASINKHAGRIRRMFRWAVENEYCSSEVLNDLQAVQGLQAGRSKAVETDPVKPVPEAYIDAVEPFVSTPVWGLIRFQLATGARPGEALIVRGCDLNMKGKVWEFKPSSHKTEHHGKQRMIFLGPKAKEVVREFLKPDLQAYLFSPRDVRVARIEYDRQPGERYNRDAYRNAIRRACLKADVPSWHPSQLRHNAGTNIRREFDIEAARTILGHASAVTSEIYAERDYEKARQIAAKIG